MEKFWTSNKSIKGLRHFVLVNKEKEKDKIVFLMVSVLDTEVNFKVTQKELVNNSNWQRGWLDLPKTKSITDDYIRFKSINKIDPINKVLINDDSFFNIS